MDPITALSLIASVFAVVQFGTDVVGVCSELVDTGSVSKYGAGEDAAQKLGSHNI